MSIIYFKIVLNKLLIKYHIDINNKNDSSIVKFLASAASVTTIN